ncbi:MAG: DUF3800 domain-containing protein [Candidatus Aminicenantes bacterium]|nr:DUF3800 domain-containing protein [Candidatus Aminicenantes bacterium]
MFLLYLDDSGSIGNTSEDYFVLGGVSLPEGSVRWLNHQVEQLAEQVWSKDPRAIEFHASEIFSGRESI